MMRRQVVVVGVVVVVGALGSAFAHEAMDLPAGPIRDRHELMEDVGKNAKAIGEAMKAGEAAKAAAPARAIAAAAKKLPALFPAGSTDPKSRAKAEIWSDPATFAIEIKALEDTATALAAAAEANKGAGDAANSMFASCKSCHTKFRVPED